MAPVKVRAATCGQLGRRNDACIHLIIQEAIELSLKLGKCGVGWEHIVSVIPDIEKW
jgi:hypothetical protein